MPLRGLFYLAKQYEKYCKEQELNLYGYRLQTIPTPRYLVFYNGEEPRGETETLYLSEAFSDRSGVPSLEVTATMINVNYGHNQTILSACKPLEDFAKFINYVRINQKEGLPLSDAIDVSIDRAIEENLLDGFFSTHKAEVIGMILSEYNEKKVRKDMFEEGRAEGKAEGAAETICALSKKLNIPEAELQAMLS